MIMAVIALAVSCKKKNETPTPSSGDFCIKRKFTDNSSSTPTTELFKYQGGLLVYYNSDINRKNYNSTFEKAEYTYANGVLSKMTVYSNNGQTLTTTSYVIANNQIISYTTQQSGLLASTGTFPKGEFLRDGSGNVIAEVIHYSLTEKDSLAYTRNGAGSVTSTKQYKNGVLNSTTSYTFDNQENTLTERTKTFNNTGTLTSDTQFTYTLYNTKSPFPSSSTISFFQGYKPGFNTSHYIRKTETETDEIKQSTNNQIQITTSLDANNRLIKEHRERYNSSKNTWELYYDFDYEYTCE